MSTPQLFKVAYARGVQHALVNTGAINKYANEAIADLAAAVAAGEVPDDLDVAEVVVPDAVTGEVAAKLVELSEAAQDTAAAAQEQAVAAEDAVAAVSSLDAAKEAVARAKAAAAASDIGGTGGGMDNPGNHLTQAAAITAEGAIEAEKRPEGYANNRPAAEMHPSAQQGQQTLHPGAPGSAYAFDHSSAGKSASVNLDGPTAAAILRKLAMGGGTDLAGATGGGVEEGQHVSDLTGTAEGKAEAAKRPDAYANSAPAVSEPAVQQGGEAAHPDSPTGITLEGKVASAFDLLFRKTAQEVGPHLPRGLSDENKIAAVRTMIGMSNQERASYIGRLAKHAGENPFAKKDDEDEDEKKDEKSEEEIDGEREKESAATILRSLGFGG